MKRILNLALLGPPGAGKSVQSARLAGYYHLPHIYAGQLMRDEVAAGTELGKAVEEYLAEGKLAPDDLVMQLLRSRLAQEDAERGFVLDGSPRTLAQAQELDSLLDQLGRPLTAVLLLQLPDSMVMARLLGRLVCADCGAIFHARYRPPLAGNVCPACRTVLHVVDEGQVQCENCSAPVRGREDDRPEIVRERLEEYHRETGPAVEHYRSKGLLREIDATPDEGEVFARILRSLGEPAPVVASQPAGQTPKHSPETREGLRFGIDVDGTIVQAPHHFKRLIDALLAHGDRVYIVTARFESTRQETAGILAGLGIRYTEMAMRPDDWPGTVADFKVNVVREKRLHLTIDDDELNCRAISQQTEALAAHMLPFPEIPDTPEVGAKLDKDDERSAEPPR